MKPFDYCAKRCFLCDEVNNQKPLSYYLGFYQNPSDKIIAESPHFIAFPDISPIVPGHTLLLPKTHLLSFAQIPNDHWAELQSLKLFVMAWIKQHFEHAFLFEHGSMPGEIESGMCVQHAHLHIIPAQIEIVNKLQSYSSNPICLQPTDIQKALNYIKTTYLYYEDSDGMGCVVQPNRSLPHQFIRMIVAQSYHLPDWDWKGIALPYLL